MDLLTGEDFERLIGTRTGACASLYMPTHRSLPEARQDPIRFKNLLREIENALAERALRTPQIRQFLKPGEELQADSLFWRHQADGLAAFLSVDGLQSYRLPISFPELAVMGHRFHVKPLLPMLNSDDRFFVLALSKNNVRLIEGTRSGAAEIEVQNMPTGLSEVLERYDFEDQLQFHTRAPQTGERAAVFHGHGGVDDLKPRISEYFRRINDALCVRLANERAPLVLAGVQSLFPLYHEVNSYQKLLDQGITGNSEMLTPRDLSERAWHILEPYFLSERHAAESKYHALAGTGRTSNDLKEAVIAAHDGRIEVLFVAEGVQIWGDFHREHRSVVVHENAEADDRDLLDVCAIRTITNRGTVYAVEPNAVPGDGLVAAVFRY